jgi:hypothetical protein
MRTHLIIREKHHTGNNNNRVLKNPHALVGVFKISQKIKVEGIGHPHTLKREKTYTGNRSPLKKRTTPHREYRANHI